MKTTARTARISTHGINPDTTAILGIPFEANAAYGSLRRYAAAIEQATSEIAKCFSRMDWTICAHCLTGHADLTGDPREIVPAKDFILSVVRDQYGLKLREGKWRFGKNPPHPCVTDVMRKLEMCHPIHGEAVLAAVRWYGDHVAVINDEEDEWWTVEFRKRHTPRWKLWRA